MSAHSARDPGAARRMWRATRLDWVTANVARRTALLVVALAVAYEWGVGNDVVTPWLSALLLSRFGGGVGGVLIAACAAASFTLAQQAAVGLLALYALGVFPSVASIATTSVHERFGFDVPSWRDLPHFQAAALSFSLGGTFVAVEEVLAGAPRRERTTCVSALTCAAMVFTIVGLVGALVVVTAGTALAGPSRMLMKVLSNPLPWLLLAILPFVVRHARRRRPGAASGGEEHDAGLQDDVDSCEGRLSRTARATSSSR